MAHDALVQGFPTLRGPCRSRTRTSNKKSSIIDDKNNFGSQNYDGILNKIGNYKFSKLDEVNQLYFKPVFLDDGLIFFNKKGSIIRYNNNYKASWKQNYYSKYTSGRSKNYQKFQIFYSIRQYSYQ